VQPKLITQKNQSERYDVHCVEAQQQIQNFAQCLVLENTNKTWIMKFTSDDGRMVWNLVVEVDMVKYQTMYEDTCLKNMKVHVPNVVGLGKIYIQERFLLK
jgi:hypothetical protein